MCVTIHFYSYFKELTGCAETTLDLPQGGSLGDLLKAIASRFPKLAPMHNSILAAVGVDYQDRDYALKPGDEVSLFPPVQGG